MLTKNELTEVLNNIKKIEGYAELKPFAKGMRQTFISENGEVVIINCTKSTNQPLRKGNFAEILSKEDVWNHISHRPYGCYYAIVSVNGKLVYYRADIKSVVLNREKDKESKSTNRYLCSILVEDAENGLKFMRINGGNSKKVTLFMTERIDIDTIAESVPCYVYLMTDTNNGYTKIGISNNPPYREGTLQSEKPNIILKKHLRFSSRNDALAKETELHKKYKDYNTRGEWFNLSAEQLVELLNEYDWRQPTLA